MNIYLVSLGLVNLPVKEGTTVKISPNFAMNFERKPSSLQMRQKKVEARLYV